MVLGPKVAAQQTAPGELVDVSSASQKIDPVVESTLLLACFLTIMFVIKTMVGCCSRGSMAEDDNKLF